MSRFELGGHEGPNPIEALPSAFVSDTPAYLVSLPTGNFNPAEYMSFGYTHYEVSCIGGAGGNGGEARDKVKFNTVYRYEVIPPSIWPVFVQVTQEWYGRGDTSGVPGMVLVGDPSRLVTVAQYDEMLYPDHKYQRAIYSDPHLTHPVAWGGGGGGGGLHVVSGRLADLPEAVPVVVGQAGVEGDMGHNKTGAPYTPLPRDVEFASNTFWAWQSTYPLPHPVFPSPQSGSNGGASSFNGDMCVASGGKGGKAAIRWASGYPFVDGAGGDGGSGGRSAAGGGAPGAITENMATDGTWDGEVGQGGGGGHGGSKLAEFLWDALNNEWSGRGSAHDAGDGGQGSFSYADTSVFGPRERKQTVTLLNGEPVLIHTGVPLFDLAYTPSPVPLVLSVLGGGGGGATRGSWKRGSHALGFSPDGAVLIRVYKVVD